ncbi:transposase domain-containing protein [Kitasatospora sp. NBC_00374]|uniref:hypothetical protein n=1 Tax=Kitasatospora sp. NBC_00374 TaxID=2975964 RepID=UPI0030E183F0
MWGKLTAALDTLAPVRPAAPSLARARRRVGTAPLRRLFETRAGPVADRGQAGSFYRGLRTVALDGTYLHAPDDAQVTWRYPKRVGQVLEFGYPLLPSPNFRPPRARQRPFARMGWIFCAGGASFSAPSQVVRSSGLDRFVGESQSSAGRVRLLAL